MEAYNPLIREKEILRFWEKEGIYKFDKRKKGKIYSIDTPPPTVSGDMHIGHAFSYSQQDFIARFQRMLLVGRGQVFYPFGTDDNGLPTERLVEKMNNVRSKEVSRSDFIDLCLRSLKEITPGFIQQWKNIGISADYNLYYSTIGEAARRISQKSFIELYKKKLAYKANFPTLWCPECQTAIAQAELEDKNIASNFITIKFHAGGKDLPIATTRPELIGACVAIFVNPKDTRYKGLKGKKTRVPLFGHEVPIIFDDSASMDKGTGAMMVCSYGDKYDVDAIARYKLVPRIVFDKQGRVIEGKYHGLRVKQARKAAIEDLQKENLVKEIKPITHTVNVHDKCGTEIEFIPTEQWFVKIMEKKKTWLSQAGKIKWLPEHMKKRYDNWVQGLQWDWNISRDRHFGIPIPVWHCRKCDEVILATEKELPLDPSDIDKKCSKCKSIAEPETKVLDTWATSSLTPEIISSLADGKVKQPFSLRPQAHDIIRTWAFYTIVKSYLHENSIPWKEIAISGNVSLGGEKMSKSKGNIINPKDVISLYGADALRFWAAGSKLGEDMDYQEKDVLTGKKFVNKLVNASNFVFMNMKNYVPNKPKKLEKIDELWLNELNRVIFTTTTRFESYDYAKAKSNAEELFWEFCDNYLEVIKYRVYNGTQKEKESAFYTLYTSLLTILKFFAPITPFVTEHVYQEHFRKNEKVESIHIMPWPKNDKVREKIDKWADDRHFYYILRLIRQEKTKAQKSMNSEIVLTLTKDDYVKIKDLLKDLKHTVKAKEIKEGKEFKVEFLN